MRTFRKNAKSKMYNMNISNLIKEGSLTLAVNANDLKEFAEHIVSKTKSELEEAITLQKSEKYISTKVTCELLDVDPVSLWRWEKRHYLMPVRVGGKKRYRMSDINQMLKSN